jgi:hypothetical protein
MSTEASIAELLTREQPVTPQTRAHPPPSVLRQVTNAVIEMACAMARVDATGDGVHAVTLRADLWRRLEGEIIAQQHMVLTDVRPPSPWGEGPMELVISTPGGAARILKGAE